MRSRVACHLATNTLALIVGVFICSSYLQASTPNPILSNLAPNTAKYLGPYTCTAVAGEPQTWCKIVHDYSGMVYDPNRHQMVIFGGGHASTNYDAINTFNLDSLKWVEEYLPTPCSSISPENYDRTNGAWRSGPSGPYARPAARHTEDLMVVVGDELVLLASVEGNGPCSPWNFPEPYNSYELTGIHRIAHYNFITKTWTFTTAQADDHKWPGAAYDPVSKKILMVGQNGLDVYDPASKTRYRPIDLNWRYWLQDEQGNTLSHYQHGLRYNNTLTYYPPKDRFYYYERNAGKMYELNFNRAAPSSSTLVQLTTTGEVPTNINQQVGVAYDSANQVLGSGPYAGKFYAFDPPTKTWMNRTIGGDIPGTLAFQTLDYDPVNNVFIAVTGNTTDKHTYAYRWGETTPEPDTTAPAAPSNLVASASSTQVSLTWAAATDNVGVSGYKVYRNNTEIQTTAERSYADTAVSPGATYSYAVTAFDAAGNVSAPSNTATATVPAPATPLVFTSTSASGNVMVKWSTNVAASGTVFFGTNATALDQSRTDPVLATSHNVALNGLQRRTTYYYQIRATAADGTTASTAILSFTTK